MVPKVSEACQSVSFSFKNIRTIGCVESYGRLTAQDAQQWLILFNSPRRRFERMRNNIMTTSTTITKL